MYENAQQVRLDFFFVAVVARHVDRVRERGRRDVHARTENAAIFLDLANLLGLSGICSRDNCTQDSRQASNIKWGGRQGKNRSVGYPVPNDSLSISALDNHTQIKMFD